MKSYFYCPQCGGKTFYITQSDGKHITFHIDRDYHPFPAKGTHDDLLKLDLSIIRCESCTWSGTVRELVRFYYR